MRVFEGKYAWYLEGHPGHTVLIPKDGRVTFDGNLECPTFVGVITEGRGINLHKVTITRGILEYSKCSHGCTSIEIPVWNEAEW